MCANVRRAQELVDSHSDDVHMEPPMDYEKYKTSKIMYNENISWIYLIIGIYFSVLRVRFYFYETEADAEKQREFTHERVFPALCQRSSCTTIAYSLI